MEELNWKFTPDKINSLQENLGNDKLNSLIDSWWEAWDNKYNTTQEEIDEIETAILSMK